MTDCSAVRQPTDQADKSYVLTLNFGQVMHDFHKMQVKQGFWRVFFYRGWKEVNPETSGL